MSKIKWRDIPYWEGFYQVSDTGLVRSIDRYIPCRGGGKRFLRGRKIKPYLNKHTGYRVVVLRAEGKKSLHTIAQLVAMAFLGYNPNGRRTVVDHIDGDKTNDRLSNLQIISNRENIAKSKRTKSSKYPGVYFRKDTKKWRATITINGKTHHIGNFSDELQAAKAYENKLKTLCL